MLLTYYTGGGVKVQNGKRYLTAETPPDNENSTVVPTTAWVDNAMDTAKSICTGVWIGRGNNTLPNYGTWRCIEVGAGNYSHSSVYDKAGGSIPSGKGDYCVFAVRIA